MSGELIAALVIAVPSLLIGLLTYRRSRKVDSVSAQSGVASNHRAGTAQIIEGLNSLIDQLQEENGRLRADATDRAARLETMTLDLARIRKKYSVDGD